MDGIEKRLRDCADNPAANGMAPVHPATLREAAHEIERRRDEVRIAVEEGAKRLSEIEELRFQYEHLDGLWRKLVEAAQEAGHVNGEESDFAYLLMSLRMGPPDRYRTALGRIAGMEQPPGGLSQMVGMMKQIARNALDEVRNG